MRALPFGFLGPRGPSAQCEEGWGPPLRSSHDAGAPPCTPAYYFTMRGATPLCTPRGEGAPPLRPRVTFPSRGKSPKARQGLCPLESPEGDASLPLRCPHPLDRVSVTNPDRFATLSRWTNRSCFFPLVSSREHSVFSIRGAVGGFPPKMLEGLSSRNQYR